MATSLREQRDRASLHLLFALFVLLPLTVVFGHRGVAPWLFIAALPAFARGDFWQSAFGALFDRLNLRDPLFAGLAALAFFCLWIFASGFWSPKKQPLLGFFVLGPALVGGSVVWFSLHLNRLWSYRLSLAFAISIAAGMGVLLLEGLTGGMLRSLLPPEDPSPDRIKDSIALGRGVTALAPSLFPAAVIAAFLWRRLAAAGLLALGAATAFSNVIEANSVAIVIGLGAGLVAYPTPRAAVMATAAILIAALALAPLAALIDVEAAFALIGDALPASWLQRLSIWQTAAAQIKEGLPFGFGADYTRIWQQSSPLIEVPGAPRPLTARGLHPHNLFLQIWLELGLPGVVSFAVFLYCGARILCRADITRMTAAAIVGAVIAFFATILVDGSLWQVWRFASIALAAMGAALGVSLQASLKGR